MESGHADFSYYDFKIIAKDFNNNSWKQSCRVIINERKMTKTTN